MTTTLQHFDNLQRLIDQRRGDITLAQGDEIDARIDLVNQAIRDDSRVRGFWDADDCQDFMAGQAEGSLSANAGFWLACRDWDYAVSGAFEYLSEYLGSIGLTELGDVTADIGESVSDAGERSDEIIPDTPGEWWAGLPPWGKVGIPLAIIALLVYTPWAAGVASKASK